MNEILKYDSEFSESKFKTYVDNVFIQLHMAVVTKELENVKHFLSDEVYNLYKQKVDNLTQRHLIQMYDEINVAQTEILNYQVTNTDMIIKVYILSRYLDYLMDEDGNYVSGDTDVRSERANYLTFTKKINHKEMGSVRKCPSCGASIDVNASGKCAYCGTIYNLDDKDWVLTSIETK